MKAREGSQLDGRLWVRLEHLSCADECLDVIDAALQRGDLRLLALHARLRHPLVRLAQRLQRLLVVTVVIDLDLS